LTRLSDQPGEEGPLTPAHFLLEQPMGAHLPEDELVVSLTAFQLVEKHSARQQCLNTFWEKWHAEYITNLPPIVRNHKAGGTVLVGDIVLIRDEKFGKRLHWPLAKVVKLHPGSDGKVRSVDLKTARGVVCRAIQRLHKLEICQPPEIHVSETISTNEIGNVYRPDLDTPNEDENKSKVIG
ncbi:unnamed protein product, partial [Meganyctiphanes norvegica]